MILWNYELEYWLSRYSAKNNFEEDHDVLQEFIISTSMLETKKQDMIRLKDQTLHAYQL